MSALVATAAVVGGANAATIGNTGLQPSVWLDAGTITLNDGDAVATWPDASGNNRNATQGAASRRPTFQTNEVNGLPVVRFNVDAATPNQFMAFAGALANTPTSNLTLFVVANDSGQRPTPTPSRAIAVNTRTNGTVSNGFLLGYNGAPPANSGSVTGVYAHVGHTHAGGSLQLSTFAEDNYNLFTLKRTANVSELSTFTDQGSVSSTVTWTGFTPSTLTTTQIGTEGGQNYMFGDIAEIIAFDETALTDAQKNSVNQYLGEKYGIVAAVPEPAAGAFVAGLMGLLARRRNAR